MIAHFGPDFPQICSEVNGKGGQLYTGHLSNKLVRNLAQRINLCLNDELLFLYHFVNIGTPIV